MNPRKSCLVALMLSLLAWSLPGVTFAAGSNSVYLSLASDVRVDGFLGDIVLLETTININDGGYVYLQSDGRYGPLSSGTLANAYITVDSVTVSNDSLIDWRRSTNPQQHSFNVIGSAYLSPGTHTIALRAGGLRSFYVGAGTNLSVMTQAASNVVNNPVGQDTGVYNFTTFGVTNGTPLPHSTVLQHSVFSFGEPIIALASGRAYFSNGYGDPLWTIFFDGNGEQNDSATWSDNDLWTGAETQAPFFSQAFFSNVSPGGHELSLEVGELPYDGLSENAVTYRVGAGTRLVTLNGGMTVAGKAPASAEVYNRTDYICIGSSQGWPGCPATGNDTMLSEGWVNIPSGHNGVVLFMTKSRVQGAPSDQGGTVRIFITIDGQKAGTDGVQQLRAPNGVSTRTICASYLSAGSQALSPGWHHVQAWGNAAGSFMHLSMVRDLPLIWFD